MDKHDQYIEALEGKEIPILTLDNKWHRLFTQTGETKEIKELTEINEILEEASAFFAASRRKSAKKKD